MPPCQTTAHIIAVSDLHISATQMSAGEAPKFTSDFSYDEIFASFSQYLLNCAAEAASSWQLLILGDGLDFLNTRTVHDQKPLSPNSKFAETHSKLDVIFDVYPQFFCLFGAAARQQFPY